MCLKKNYFRRRRWFFFSFFFVDVFYRFKKNIRECNSSNCMKKNEIENKKILKFCSTKWLSIGKVTDKFLENVFCAEQATFSIFICLKETFECLFH